MKCRVLKGGECIVNQGYSNKHKGSDIVGLKNGKKIVDTVVAHSEGKVIEVVIGKKNKKGSTGIESYGNYVQIEHSNGYTTFYAHLSKVNVKVGQNVKKGEEIGYMGETGNAYGIHLHFEVRKNRNYESIINSTEYINKELPNMKKRKVTYRVYNNKGKKWLNVVSDGQIAGNENDNIGGIQIRTINGGNTRYRVHIKGGKWLDEVVKWDKTDEGYAGIKGKIIDCISIFSEEGKLSYRVKTKEKGWLPYVSGYNIKDNINGYAGNIGEDIINVQIKIN